MQYADIIRAESLRVEQLVSGATPADLTCPVGACPGWTAYDLVTHLGGVHRWATAATRTPPEGRVEEVDEPRGLSPGELGEWFAGGARALLEALEVDPEQPCWTLAEPRTVAFWRRRQGHETTVHRWDLETALGEPASIDPEVALDGIHEVLEVMLPRQVGLGRIERSPQWLRLVAGGREHILTTAEHRDDEPIATLAGPAPDLLLVLWGRVGLDTLSIEGDQPAAEQLLRDALTP